MLVDFIAVGIDALQSDAAQVFAFSGGRWEVPMVVQTASEGGYGDGGQHEQALWGWLAHSPGVSVVVPSNLSDVGVLVLASFGADGPVVCMEHKLLSEPWLHYLGSGGRWSPPLQIPEGAADGPVSDE